jgi:ribosomal protein L16/L10AE
VALDLGAWLEVSALARSVGVSRGMRGRARKFGNVPTMVGDEAFHSKREAARYVVLRALERAGKIRNLRRQVKYRLEVNGMLICTYSADFVYEEPAAFRMRDGAAATVEGVWAEIVEDVKGYANDRWPMKRKLMLACHGVAVLET